MVAEANVVSIGRLDTYYLVFLFLIRIVHPKRNGWTSLRSEGSRGMRAWSRGWGKVARVREVGHGGREKGAGEETLVRYETL